MAHGSVFEFVRITDAVASEFPLNDSYLLRVLAKKNKQS